MKYVLAVLAMAVVMGGCAKENPPKPEWDSSGELENTVEGDAKSMKSWKEYVVASKEWYNNLVVCLHCGSDLKKKGAATCAECGKDQR